jgi:hypothetical protein
MQVAAENYQNPADIQSFASWCSIHGVSFSGYTNQSEGSKLFQESRFLQSARNQEEPVEVDSDKVMSTKMWADVRTVLNVVVSYN